ncbi:FtsB family cell division protein [Terriglobus aquaticus]|uniref:FtsB family cell division protein n=1 Tax=Terriglobus aquaticus TaxID=940139 RepID=A0ABW9KK42_9BACT|nr:septum formation initiator family protein [Terriglobus aquaticus]
MATSSNRKSHGKWMTRLSRLGEHLYGNRRRIATVAVAVLAVLLGYHVVFGRDGLTAFRNKQHDLRDLRTETSNLQRENGELQGHVDRLANDPNAIEHQAREDLHYTRPGEVIVTLPANDSKH